MRTITILGLCLPLTLAVASTACQTVAPDDGNPFATAATPTSAPPTSDTGDETETGGTGSSTGGASSSGAPESTSGLDSSSGMPPTTGVSAEDSTTGGGGNGMQPQSGMWMPCDVPQDCDYSPALCITVMDDMGTPLGGFCSDVGCSIPAMDCAPSPNGIAVPACANVTVNMMPDTACVLQCTGGIACPVPMQCTDVTGFGEICV